MLEFVYQQIHEYNGNIKQNTALPLEYHSHVVYYWRSIFSGQNGRNIIDVNSVTEYHDG